jgi:tetratricopeptide (TPR) repeat protein
MKRLVKILIAIALIAIVAACSTEKNTPMSRFYHNTTLKYNIYFNGRESYKKGITKINDQNSDNYALILSVFTDSKEENASVANGEMEKAIQKSAKGIKLHSITKKPKPTGKAMSPKEKEFMAQNEFNKWVDHCYMLMGKAYFIKRDYMQARQNLEFALRQYPNSKIQPEIAMYLVRTFCEDKKFKEAKETLDKIEADKKITKKNAGFYAAVWADYYLKQNNREEAAEKLKLAVEKTKKRKDKIRYIYILAQLKEKENNLKDAYKYYEEAAKRNSNYEMEFNARINMAKCYSGGKGSNKEIFKLLNKMLKDEKNKEYRDQIYYAIAEVELRTGKESDAIEHYKQSSAVSVDNNYQKALSCLKLGELYFAKLEYKNAYVYYDTCMQNITEDYDNFKEIQALTKNLSELVTFTDVIEFEDSVQKIAKMSDKERNKLIDGLIAKVVEQERLERELAQQESMNSYLFDQRRGETNNVGSSTGKWYFYNPAQLSYGKNEFQKKWGNRKNEDHWRRRDKTVVSFDSGDDSEASDSVVADARPKNEDPKSREYYLQNLPLTDSAMQESHKRIENALYNASKIYKEKFGDYPKAINSYEDLNKRYPNSDYQLLSYYDLYILNTLIKDIPQAEKYKNLIISKYGNTNYARLLQNPNFVKEQEEIRKRDEQLYANTYDAFMRGEWSTVQRNATNFINENSDSDLVPNFDFLNTMCTARNADTTQFKMALLDFIDRHPKHELKQAAENLLAYFGTGDIDALIADLKSRPEVVKQQQSEDGKSPYSEEIVEAEYKFDEMAEHYYVVYFKSEQVDDKRLAFEIRNFNIFNFNMRTFNVVTSTFNSNYSMITVRPFRNMRQSVNYSKMIANSEDVFNKLKNVDYKIFVISADNFKLLTESRNLNSYMEFYNENYNK